MKIIIEVNPIEELARVIHNEYERIAKEEGWETQKKSRVPFSKLPKENKQTMLKVSEKIFEWFKVQGELGHDDFRNFICIHKELFELKKEIEE